MPRRPFWSVALRAPCTLRRALVTGPSMAPALRHGDHVLVLMNGRREALRPGAVVVVRLPDATLAVKRLIRVIEDGRVWVEGDNPFGSTDSRTFGPLCPDSVRGRVLLRLWPRPGYIWA